MTAWAVLRDVVRRAAQALVGRGALQLAGRAARNPDALEIAIGIQNQDEDSLMAAERQEDSRALPVAADSNLAWAEF
jgi:hypothetical protein